MIIFTIDSINEIFHIKKSFNSKCVSTFFFNDGSKLHRLKSIDIKKDVFDVSGMFHEIITGCRFDFYSRPAILATMVEGELFIDDIELNKMCLDDYGVSPSIAKFNF